MSSEYEVSSTTLAINWTPSSEAEAILQNVRFILGTIAGTVPLMRGFGIERSAIDGPATKARALLMTAVYRAINKYEPRATVLAIYIDDLEALDGAFSPRVRVAI